MSYQIFNSEPQPVRPEYRIGPVEQLIQRIASIPLETRKTMPFPEEWILTNHQAMLSLIDTGILGMDGFRYAFKEYAVDCYNRCGGR